VWLIARQYGANIRTGIGASSTKKVLKRELGHGECEIPFMIQTSCFTARTVGNISKDPSATFASAKLLIIRRKDAKF
jgi:hypothetical protein